MLNPAVYRDCYNLHREAGQNLHDAKVWELFWAKANAIYQKHNCDQLCADLLIAIHADLERTANIQHAGSA